MERSEHVLLAGRGAEAFAAQQGLEIVDPAYFYTPERWESLQRAKKRDSLAHLAAPNHTASLVSEQQRKDQRTRQKIEDYFYIFVPLLHFRIQNT